MAVYSKILKKHFDNLGYDNKFFDEYEKKAEETLRNMDAMCEKLHEIHDDSKQMVIYSDFDADGIMSSVIAYAGFSQLGFNVSLFCPTPSKGYGIDKDDIDDIIKSYPDVSVIFTADVGSSCNEAMEYAKSKNIIALVTDHHISNMPSAADIEINPNAYGETYSHHDICGSTVVYMIQKAYAERYCDPAISLDISRLQVFAGIATVADIMPLRYENRSIVRESVGLAQYFYNYELSDGTISPPAYAPAYSQAFVGLKYLIEFFFKQHKIRSIDDIDEVFYGYYLIPFLNSCKRMDGDMHYIYDIFFSDRILPIVGYEDMRCVANGINYVQQLKLERKRIEIESCNAFIIEREEGKTFYSHYMPYGIYIKDDMRKGLCGLIANQFMNETHLPTFVLYKKDDGSYEGSGRCPDWLDIDAEFRTYCKDENKRFVCQGHKGAFGVSIPNDDALDTYISFYNNVIIPMRDTLAKNNKITTDSVITISDVRRSDCEFVANPDDIIEFLDDFKDYHPYGKSFPAPVFKLKFNPRAATRINFGKVPNDIHIRFVLNNGIEIVLFSQRAAYESLLDKTEGQLKMLECTGSFKYDTFNKEDRDYDVINFVGNIVDYS